MNQVLKKTVTWRCISLLLLFFFGYLITRSVVMSGAVTIVHQTAGTVLYYLHEKWYERKRRRVG